MGLRVANKPVLDSENYATATVVRSEFGKGTETIRRGKDDVDTREYERFELEFAVDGTAGLIPMTVFTGTSLNGVLEESGRGKTKKAVYNRLTTICLGLGLVKPSEVEGTIALDVVERVQDALVKLEGDRVRFKMGKVEGRSLTVPVPDTIERVKD